MLAIQLTINNSKKKLIAGLDIGVLTTTLYYINRGIESKDIKKSSFELHVGGLQTDLNQHIIWLNKNLKVGDSINIEIIETKKVGRHIKVIKIDDKRELKAKKEYVIKCAKEFGWNIKK